MNPIFYIVIPFYNVELYLKECIQSVLDQTYRHFKVILVNDGSTDRSLEIAKEFLKNENICLISQENKGAGSARNVGLEIAIQEASQEDFVVFVDSDDALNRSYLHSVVRVLTKHPKTEVFIGSAQDMSQDGVLGQRGISRDEEKVLNGIEYLSTFSGDYPSYVGGAVIKISFLKGKRIRFIEGILNEDLHFGFEVFRHAKMIGFFDDVFFYRHREGSVSCTRTFFRHPNDLIFRSYMTNVDYLLSLLENQALNPVFPLVKRTLKKCAQIPVLCWLRDRNLCLKKDLSHLLPYMGNKARLAYYFPPLARIWVEMRKF